MYSFSRPFLLQLNKGITRKKLIKDGPRWCTNVDNLILCNYFTEPVNERQVRGSCIRELGSCITGGSRSHHFLLEDDNQVFRNSQQQRWYRSGRSSRGIERQDDKAQPQKTSPELMNFPWIIWPSLWHTIRNWIFANLIIRRYLDQEFSLASFKSGAIQALVHVSHDLSQGNFGALDELITKPTLEEIQRNFSLLSLKQRLDLAVVAEDIFFSFPYQIGIIFTNEGTSSERIFVEITMVYHVFRGFQDHLKNSAAGESPGGLKGVYDNYDRISIANYRFIREFTRGVEDQWTVSLANHFKPGEYIQQQ
ncbi:m-AAA protease-interacting protein 1, mitochondrial [Panulirus ornatus]|uniref:m-AAA protease-interacting protein 1, mitochondrial n=1 Tax=Panulirus ornatus TaxID=150431 RepID=UPI003A8A8DB2